MYATFWSFCILGSDFFFLPFLSSGEVRVFFCLLLEYPSFLFVSWLHFAPVLGRGPFPASLAIGGHGGWSGLQLNFKVRSSHCNQALADLSKLQHIDAEGRHTLRI